jgi:hypothetical protein
MLATSLFVGLLTLFAHGWFAAPVDAAPPNILLIVSDDQGYNDLGIHGNGIITPTLDRLAAEGTRLTNFYVSWPACTPSRGSLLTGRSPQRNGIYDMIRNEAPDYGHQYTAAEYAVSFERIGGMDSRELLLPEFLGKAGYRSAIYGKWDLGALRRYLPTSRGFDDFYGFVNTGIDYYTHERYGVPSMVRNLTWTEEDKGTYATYLFEREALRFLDEPRGESPFFLYLPFNAPHNSSSLDPRIRTTVQAPERYQRMYPPVAEETREVASFRYASPATVTTRTAEGDYFARGTSVDKDANAMRGVLEWIAVVQGDVRVLAGLQTTDSVGDPQDTGRVDGDSGQGLLQTQTVGGGDGRLEQHNAHLGNVPLIAALHGDRNSCFHQVGRRLEAQILVFPRGSNHGRVQQHRNLSPLDFLDQQISLRGAVQPNPNPELIGQSQGRGNVLGLVGRDQ